MMKRMAGLLAGAALIGGLALAQQDSTPSTAGSSSTSSTGSTTGSTGSTTGSTGTMGSSTSAGPGIGGSGLNQDQSTLNQQATQQAAVPGQASGQIRVGEQNGKQISGTVVESKTHTLYLQHMGVVVPVRVDKSTDLAGKKLADLKPGEEVQVSFMVKNKLENVATKIEPSSTTGIGGSGLGTSDESRNLGIGGSGSAGSTKPGGEDVNVGKPVYPEERPMKQPYDPGLKHGTEDEKPLY